METKNPLTTSKLMSAHHKRFTGMVVSSKMKDTVVVVVDRFEKHTKYQKFLRLRKRYKVDDKGNTAKIGDRVIIEETRPISRHKHFKLAKILVPSQEREEEIVA